MGSSFFHSKPISFNTAMVAADRLLLLTLVVCPLLLLPLLPLIPCPLLLMPLPLLPPPSPLLPLPCPLDPLHLGLCMFVILWELTDE